MWSVRSERGSVLVCPTSNGLALESAGAFVKGGGLECGGGGELL